jgi:hypothetical protein
VLVHVFLIGFGVLWVFVLGPMQYLTTTTAHAEAQVEATPVPDSKDNRASV